MSHKLRVLLLLAALQAAVPAAAQAPPPTLKDLKRSPPKIHAGETVAADAERARALYRGFLETPGGHPALRTEALRRLGDLELEAGDAERADTPVPGAGAPETRAAIDIYTRLLADNPDYARADEVLYQLSRAWEAEGDPERALLHLDTLVSRHAGSRYLPEAQFRRGEIHFSAQRWAAAEMAYQAVIGSGAGSDFYEQALYKHGWSLFRQSAAEASAGSFLTLLDRKLLDAAREDGVVLPAMLPRADRELVEDSFRALSIQFADLEAGESLGQALARHGGAPYAWLLHAALGDLLVEKERYTDAADTYRRFARAEPRHRRAPTLQARAIDAYLAGGFADLALQGKREFVEAYGVAGPFWQERGRDSAPEVVAQLKTHLADVARHHHATAQAGGVAAEYLQAARWYREYLESFPDDPEAAATRYLLADALFEAGDFRNAALEYERTAYDYPAGPRSSMAAYASLVAYARHEEQLDEAGRPAWRRAGIDSQLRFAASFPEHPEAAPVELRAAQQLYNLREFAPAAEAAARAAVHIPPLPPTEERIAWNVVADARFELAEFAAAEAAYGQLLARLPPGDAERSALEERLAASIYQQADGRQQAGDTEAAITGFLRVAQVAPGSAIRVTATYDAAALLVRTEQWSRAIPVLEALRREFPTHPLAADVPRNLAAAYLGAGRGGEAADELTLIAADAREPAEVRRAALLESADLYEQAGEPTAASGAWAAFVERYPEPLDESMAARQKLADLATAAADPPARRRWLEAIIAADAAAGPARTDSSRVLAARAALELAQPTRLAFEGVTLTVPLQASLRAKRAAMEQALTAYQAANAYGVAEVATAATYATAEIYRRLAADLLGSERPRGLDADALEQYDLLLEEQAYPFEEKAIELHEANAIRAAQGLYDESVQASFAALAALMPARYAKVEIEPTEDAIELPAAELTRAGVAHRQAGRFAEARAAYEEALLGDPGYATAALNLAVLLDLYLGEPGAALGYYQRYAESTPEIDPRVERWSRDAANRAGVGPHSAGVSP
jgi:cellulose synthase operon protein C